MQGFVVGGGSVGSEYKITFTSEKVDVYLASGHSCCSHFPIGDFQLIGNFYQVWRLLLLFVVSPQGRVTH